MNNSVKERQAYSLNKGLDLDGDRRITIVVDRSSGRVLEINDQIRAAMPRMTPMMRRVAEAVITESGN